jgi:hypothetical protein
MQLDNQIASRDWRLRSANSNHIPGATGVPTHLHMQIAELKDSVSVKGFGNSR